MRRPLTDTQARPRTSAREARRLRAPRGAFRARRVAPAATARQRQRTPAVRETLRSARGTLAKFRQASVLAVAMTSFLLLLLAPAAPGEAQPAPDAAPAQPAADDASAAVDPAGDPEQTERTQRDVREAALRARAERPAAREVARAARDEAGATLRGLWRDVYGALPRIVVALVLLAAAWLLVRLIRTLLRRALRRWEHASAATALTGVAVWTVVLGIAVSVLVGDVRGLVGSLGLVGLALSWALQRPIESVSGWLLNSFQGYYRIGDRVAVGDSFGDVHEIDFLTTTLWEIGSADRPGAVHAEQPTGRLITFPNSEVVSGTVVNFTRMFPYVWDELVVAVANESDIRFAMELLQRVADEALADAMAEPARRYGEILRAARLELSVAERPQVFVSLAESWTELTVRYLVNARERRKWKSELTLRVIQAQNDPAHRERVIAVYPRRQVQLVGADGKPRE